jgi:hypothetical protein
MQVKKPHVQNEQVQEGYNQNSILWGNSALFLVPSNSDSHILKKIKLLKKKNTEQNYDCGSILEQKIQKVYSYIPQKRMWPLMRAS